VAPQAKGRILIAVILTFQPLACIALVSVQALPAARVGIVGSFDGQLHKPVTVALTLPKGYGLAAGEGGLPPLNKPTTQQAILDKDFTLTIPKKQLYCTTHFWWQHHPPPPALFVARFSDAADEDCLIYGGDYLVRSGRITVPHDRATWQLRIDGFERVSSEYPPLWLLRLRVRRTSGADTDEPAVADVSTSEVLIR
jgi:hypothetical protein